MIQSLEQAGRTVEEAVDAALGRMGVSREQVEVEVMEEGNRGFLGIGSRDALVRVTLVPGKAALVRDLLSRVLCEMGFSCQVEVDEDDRFIHASVSCERSGLLIGRHGQTINSLQYLINITAGRASTDRRQVVIDVADYRRKRQRSLEGLARKMASRARRQSRPVSMDPMPAHERRIVHLALQEVSGVSTTSEGHDPHRRVVIIPEK